MFYISNLSIVTMKLFLLWCIYSTMKYPHSRSWNYSIHLYTHTPWHTNMQSNCDLHREAHREYNVTTNKQATVLLEGILHSQFHLISRAKIWNAQSLPELHCQLKPPSHRLTIAIISFWPSSAIHLPTHRKGPVVSEGQNWVFAMS